MKFGLENKFLYAGKEAYRQGRTRDVSERKVEADAEIPLITVASIPTANDHCENDDWLVVRPPEHSRIRPPLRVLPTWWGAGMFGPHHLVSVKPVKLLN